ncbi:MAG TPA: SGNH/GDSL hydrolase family protein [Chthoniobacteraceae bacterium]|nr:SGNH/GDSL hydrolase family protein [Chthoniobacteraceae bacterium]
MKISLLLSLLFLPVALFAQAPEKRAARPQHPSLAPVTDTPGLPRVLLIGDSISMGYTVPVRGLLAGKANVHRVPGNAFSTREGLEGLSRWLGNGKWDVIHFNWGLHDLKHWKDGKMDMSGDVVANVEDYAANLRLLIERMKPTGAKLVWAPTTPIPEGSDGRVAGDEVRYNAAAERVVKEAGVAIDDLHAFALPRLAQIQKPKNVHYTDEGYRVLAEKVADSIREQLPR